VLREDHRESRARRAIAHAFVARERDRNGAELVWCEAVAGEVVDAERVDDRADVAL
jgi:hypothetical protein